MKTTLSMSMAVLGAAHDTLVTLTVPPGMTVSCVEARLDHTDMTPLLKTTHIRICFVPQDHLCPGYNLHSLAIP